MTRDLDALRVRRDQTATDLGCGGGAADDDACRVQKLRVDVRVVRVVAVEGIRRGDRGGRVHDVDVTLRSSAKSLGEDGGAGVGDRVRGVLGHPLVGVGVAALEHERDAADHRDQRKNGHDEDLAAFAIRAEQRGGGRVSW